jgi:hypothetical protein
VVIVLAIRPRSHVIRFYGMLKIPVEYERDTSPTKFTAISRKVSFASLLGVCTGCCQRTLVVESEMITTRMGTHNR